MSFPLHDRAWVAVTAFVEERVRPGDTVLADDLFTWRFPVVHRYRNTWIRPEQGYDWAILHKGQLDQLEPKVLDELVRELHPVFANDVFVVWSSRPGTEPVEERHLAAFHAIHAAVHATDVREPVDTHVHADPGVLVQFRSLDDRGLRGVMDAFWRNGGYEYSTPRDVAYNDDLGRHLRDLADARPWRRTLDLACGARPLPASLTGPGVVRADLSIEAVREARRGDDRDRSFANVDGADLPFADDSFDLVVFLEAIEHVRNVERVLDEVGRVVRPGGTVFVSAANPRSLHLRLTRALGYEEFATNLQHITEMTHAELVAHLEARHLRPVRSAGVYLYPYWAVPGMPEVIGRVVDEDPELVRTLRELGELVGPDHAYTAIVVAEKVRPSRARARGA